MRWVCQTRLYLLALETRTLWHGEDPKNAMTPMRTRGPNQIGGSAWPDHSILATVNLTAMTARNNPKAISRRRRGILWASLAPKPAT